ncbi:MAG: hypothetical protein WCF57_14455 [Pyrinomonadaceae bacterium]
MNQKPKRGLQRGLSDIVEKQTAPVEDKKRESADLISRFSESKTATPLPPPPTTSYHQSTPAIAETAPKRDFARVPNSITRDALPAGLFKGTSKKLYDALYLRTRGAILPIREIKARQSELMLWAQVSHNTLRAHLRHLEAAGLVIRRWELGDNDGAVYEIFIPEEVLTPPPSNHLPPPPPTTNQKLVGPSTQNVVVGGGGQVADNSTTYENPKTLIKTNTERDDDDAALAGLNATLKQAAQEVTGRELSESERERWRELGEVLATELKIAAARTTVSSAPSFLAEHLRRRLWKKDKRELQAEILAPTSHIGHSSSINPEQIKQCPDCGGTGFRYKGENFTGGVEKCKHEKLEATSVTDEKSSDQA